MRLAALSLALLASSATADAQDRKPAQNPGPPPIMIRAEDPVERDYLAKCGPGAEAVEVTELGVERVALVRNQAGPVVIVACMEGARVAYPVEVDSLYSALVFLAYKPFAPFWPYAEARWGDDLSRLRQHLAEEARAQAPDYSPYALQPASAVAVNRARRLQAIGYFDEARSGLVARTGELLARKKRKDRDKFDLAMLALARASLERAEHGYAAAADYLAEFARTVDVGREYEVNLLINRAAYLAESGRADEVVALLKPLYDKFDMGAGDTRKSYQIGGSEREFSWILACAYSHKGQAEVAAQYAAVVNTAEETPADQYMDRTKPSSAIRMRMARCMDDPAGYFAVWHDARPAALAYPWLDFQRQGRVINGVARPWAERPEAVELGANYRQLPDRYRPALNMWKAAAPPAP